MGCREAPCPRAVMCLVQGARCGTTRGGQCKKFGMVLDIAHGLWRQAGAFFQIGFGCVMSHHHTCDAYAYSCSNFGGKIKLEFLLTVILN